MWFPHKLCAALIAVGLLAAVPASAQITPTYTFTDGTVISAAQVNTNFNLFSNALNRTGGTITGNIIVTAGITIDGIDLSAWLNQSVQTTASPTFVGLTLSGAVSSTSTAQFSGVTITGTGASALDVGGGINAGTGNVALVTAAGKITAISSTYFDSLDGTNLTGVAKLASANTFTAGNSFLTYDETDTSPAIAAGALTLNLALGSHFQVALNANITSITISNPPSASKTGAFTVTFTADGSVRTITWPAAVKWPGGVAPTMTGTNTKKDIISCLTYDGGTEWLCVVGGQNF